MENNNTKTFFASPEKKSREDILQVNKTLREDALLNAILKFTPIFLGVLNSHRQLVLVNEGFFANPHSHENDDFLGLRVGEVMGCEVFKSSPSGCGTGELCRFCEVVGLVLRALKTGESQEGRASLRLETEANVIVTKEFIAKVEPIDIEGQTYGLLFLQDDSARAHKKLIERVFFHDVLNAANNLSNLTKLMELEGSNPEEKALYQSLMGTSAQDILEQVIYYRDLTRAEEGMVDVNWDELEIHNVLENIVKTMRSGPLMKYKQLKITSKLQPVVCNSDKVILRRICINTIKNAIEACDRGQEVQVNLEKDETHFAIGIHNPGVMPPEVAAKIFKRSFSTKGIGRGLGTYSMKLLSEVFLQGKVSFHSSQEDGTVFTMRFPLEPKIKSKT